MFYIASLATSFGRWGAVKNLAEFSCASYKCLTSYHFLSAILITNSSLSLWFVKGKSSAPELWRTEFLCPLLKEKIVCIRGRTAGVLRQAGSFQWTSGVQALSYLLVSSLASIPEKESFALCGFRGSSALALDYSLSKKPLWLLDMFGSDSSGAPIALRMFIRSNPEGKLPGPIMISLNERFFSRQQIKIFLNDSEVLNTVQLTLLAHAVNKAWANQVNPVGASDNISLAPINQMTLESPNITISSRRYYGSVALEAVTDNSVALQNPHMHALVDALKIIPINFMAGKIEVKQIESDNELVKLWEIDRAAYGDASISLELFREWHSSYSKGLHALFVGRRVVGACGVWPVSKSWCMRLRSGKERESSINSAMLHRCGNEKSSYWYISGIVLDPNIRRTRAILILLNSGLRSWLQRSQVKYPLEVYALGSSAHGIALLDRVGFEQILDASQTPDGMPLYCLHMPSRRVLLNSLERCGIGWSND